MVGKRENDFLCFLFLLMKSESHQKSLDIEFDEVNYEWRFDGENFLLNFVLT